MNINSFFFNIKNEDYVNLNYSYLKKNFKNDDFNLFFNLNNNFFNSTPSSPQYTYLSTINFLIIEKRSFIKTNFLFTNDIVDPNGPHYPLNSIDLNSYIYLKKPSFISFFIENLVDIPICFKKSQSLKRKNFELPLLKFINFLMKNGKREKILKIFFYSFRKIEQKKLKDITTTNENNLWFFLYFLINHSYKLFNFFQNFKSNNIFIEFENYNKLLKFNHILSDNIKYLNTKFFFKNNLINQLKKINPIFSYFIYSVDKNIKKFSRGKSGKYVFIWKYIAPYKRFYVAMKWIIKEIKFSSDKKFSNRIKYFFFLLENNIESTFSWKSKIFSHNFVFRNFKKNLMSSLKTTS